MAGAAWGVSGSSCLSCGPGTVSSSPATPQPTISEAPQPKTFEQKTPAQEQPLKPTPDAGTGYSPTSDPTIIQPGNRTTWQPVRRATHYRLVASPAQPAAADKPRSDVGVWRASSD